MFCAQLDNDEVSALILVENERKVLSKYVSVCNRYTISRQKGKLSLDQGKNVDGNLLRDVDNHPVMLQFLEDYADILAEFCAFQTGVYKLHWKEEDNLDAGAHTVLIRL
eukprot:snap_masked-scaffold_25-processed-gene-3.40-mRNA-1 protein AED:1.00 eAED:1.00 QI:0/0/0/0/1/1/2/0/108